MGEVERARIEAELARHYASQQEAASQEAVEDLVSAMVAEDGHAVGGKVRGAGLVAFVASQVRYIPAWTWAAQVALVALMGMVARMADYPNAAKLCIGILSAACVLVGVPTVQASKLHGVAELEYSCPHNVASVMVARLVVLGCSSSLVVALMVATTAPTLDASTFDVALWACPPFFLACAGSLMALRKANPANATVICSVWTAFCSAGLLVLAVKLPNLYAHASCASWALAAALACVWLIREVALTVRAATAGLDAFSPHMARTYN